jgi:hypothetical protein
MKYLFIIFLILSAKTFAEDTPSVDLKTAHELVNALKSSDKVSVSKLLKYPIRRTQPLPIIKDAAEFVEHYDEFFDAKNIIEVEKGLSDIWTNWKGSSICSGSIWLSDGKMIVLGGEAARLCHSKTCINHGHYEIFGNFISKDVRTLLPSALKFNA